MKKVSTAAAKQSRNFSRTEADDRVGPGRSIELVLRVWMKRAQMLLEQKAAHDSEGDARSVRSDAAQPDRAGNRDAFAVGESAAERVGT